MATEKQKELLTRYVQGTCSPEEARQAAWLIRSNEFDQDLLDIIEGAMESTPAKARLTVERKTALYQSLRQRIGIEKTKPVWPWRAIAASILVLFIAGCTWLYFASVSPDNTVLAYEEIRTGDERQVISMSDSTVIWLNAHSKLKYTKAYNRAERRVVLEGQAFFKVKHNTSKPFIVEAGEVATRVLGTSFEVQAEHTSEAIAVTLMEGKVAVNRVDTVSGVSQPLTVLAPDQQMLYYKATGHTTVRTVEAREISAWKDGILNLKDVSLAEAVLRIERWYSVKIEISNPDIRNCMVHASFENEPLSKVLETLGHVNGFTHTLRGKTVTINGKGCVEKQ